jgi:hypothetical protein
VPDRSSIGLDPVEPLVDTAEPLMQPAQLLRDKFQGDILSHGCALCADDMI